MRRKDLLLRNSKLETSLVVQQLRLWGEDLIPGRETKIPRGTARKKKEIQNEP